MLIAGAAKPICYFANFLLLSIQLTMPSGSLIRWKLFYFTPAHGVCCHLGSNRPRAGGLQGSNCHHLPLQKEESLGRLWQLCHSISRSPVPCLLSAALCLETFILSWHMQNPWRIIPLAAAQKQSLLLGKVTELLHHSCTGWLVLCATSCCCPAQQNKTKAFVLLLAVCQGNGFW